MRNKFCIKNFIFFLIIFFNFKQASCTTPVADFKISITGLNANFTDRSSNTPTAWFWSFGDPSSTTNTSDKQNPTHVYSAAGNYTVTLFAVNADGRTIKTQTITIVEPPVANFSASITGLTTSFTDTSTKSPTSWTWIFGDSSSTSNTSTLQNPTHTYSAPGTYTVTMFAANAGGRGGAKTDITVSVSATDFLNAIKTITNYDATSLESLLKIVINSIFNNDSFQGANGGDLIYTLLKGFFDNRTTIGLPKLSDGVNGLLDITRDKSFLTSTQKQGIADRITIIGLETELTPAFNNFNSATDKLAAIKTFINSYATNARILRTKRTSLTK